MTKFRHDGSHYRQYRAIYRRVACLLSCLAFIILLAFIAFLSAVVTLP